MEKFPDIFNGPRLHKTIGKSIALEPVDDVMQVNNACFFHFFDNLVEISLLLKISLCFPPCFYAVLI